MEPVNEEFIGLAAETVGDLPLDFGEWNMCARVFRDRFVLTHVEH